MTTLQIYTKGARVWIPHPQKIWEGSIVKENFSKDKLFVVTEDGQEKELKITSDDDLPPLRNPDILVGENDLTSLSYLHEPAVLHNLQVRFCRNKSIYTYCGIVLVAINPYTDVSIYDPGTIWAYRGQAMGDLDPHIFAVAEEAYTKMEREQRDQSIIVSGESGAGKTVSAKYAMRYFATVGGSTTETQVERKVLASSPIMEAIGNAKTTRNDNSSRFGKYIELQFNRKYTIVGASMSTYLLEKSRVVFQGPGERNYHIFYQMCASRDKLSNLQLDNAEYYHYLCETDSSIPGVDDGRAYDETVDALTTLGFPKTEITDILICLASILHLGNITFTDASGDGEASYISKKDKHLSIISNLLDIDGDELSHTLTNRKIVSTRESFNKPMTCDEAVGARDALAKHIYACLFSSIVSTINRALKTSAEVKNRFIGVLDIYGFETFDVNSFEQFCINYANEKLQQQFNMHVFKLEQEEYVKESIEWTFIDFYDNQKCIDLIESKLGILDLLDEECKMPRGSDVSWAEKLYSKCSKWPHFEKPRFGGSAFILKHFADKVNYEVIGFLEKNKDTVLEEQVDVLRKSKNKLIHGIFRDREIKDKLLVPKTKVKVIMQSAMPSSASAKNKKTVGSQFRDSLNALMTTLNATTPHYIRCIKPNDDKEPFKYNYGRVVQQLRACGVLETIRISTAGFPSRWLYFDFLKRYRVLCKSTDIVWEDKRKTCENILSYSIKDNDKFKFGNTKIFFRAGQVAYLERLRSEKLLACCIRIQSTVRGFLARCRYKKILSAIQGLQRLCRGYLARRLADNLRRNKAAVTIQRYVLGWMKWKQYQRTRKTILGLQAYSRGLLARRAFQNERRTKAAIKIQCTIRGWLCRKRYQKLRNNVIICQSAVRRFLARRRFRNMKREARSAEHLKKLNKGLENKIISLQQKLGDKDKEMSYLKGVSQENDDLRQRINAMRGIEVHLKGALSEISEKEKKLQELQRKSAEMEAQEKERKSREKEQLSQFIKEKEGELEKFTSRVKELSDENSNLKTNLRIFEEQLKNLKQEREEFIEKIRLIDVERQEERVAHQRLLSTKNTLEERIEIMEVTLMEATNKDMKSHKRSSSDTSTISVQDDDNGYGSVKSTSTTRGSTPTPDQQIDIGLVVLNLQRKLKTVISENSRMQFLLAESDRKSSVPDSGRNKYMSEELEMQNARLRNENKGLREAITSDGNNKTKGKALDELNKSSERWQTEAIRAREEAAVLREALSAHVSSTSSLAKSSYTDVGDANIINEDGELVLAFEAQKKTLRQVESELQWGRTQWELEREELVAELNRTRLDYDKLRENIIAMSQDSSQDRSQTFFKTEIARISADYLELQEKYDLKSAKCRKLQQRLNELRNRLVEAGMVEEVTEKINTSELLPVVKKQERKVRGMFEFQIDDISDILKQLLGLKPKVAIKLLPGLPAYILFMCIRYTDYVNNENMLQRLIMGYAKQIKNVVVKKLIDNDIDVGILWLANTLRLVHNLKQYSGDQHFSMENTSTQNEQCLISFDLSEIRQMLGDQAIAICQAILKRMCELVQPYAVAAIVEHEAISGLSGSSTRGRSASVGQNLQDNSISAINQLLEVLSKFHRSLNQHCVDPQLPSQLFIKIFYNLCAHSLNNLLLRKEYCHWSKGMQIRYNLSHLEQWVREEKLQDTKILDTLVPIIQASQLLQARKTDADVEAVAEMCSSLTINQIVKLLNLYTPMDTYEEKVTEHFITSITNFLKEKRKGTPNNALMMDVNETFALEFPFNPSNIRLEDIELPEVLKLPMLKKI